MTKNQYFYKKRCMMSHHRLILLPTHIQLSNYPHMHICQLTYLSVKEDRLKINCMITNGKDKRPRSRFGIKVIIIVIAEGIVPHTIAFFCMLAPTTFCPFIYLSIITNHVTIFAAFVLASCFHETRVLLVLVNANSFICTSRDHTTAIVSVFAETLDNFVGQGIPFFYPTTARY